ncbi:uncharacterized protein LOC113495388 [Trichoplusia ni]|uniref:Uncharacterized protein LOC113495388 n=1 Tax=Trichoplusia ni TaxID=7111 RepID=A0A7E5VNN0_TRINI|nr:uncharacterized protein LOC113495388 [Trichoplusia ni]
MSPVKYEPPTATFPYKIPKRLNLLSAPRKYFVELGEGMPEVSKLSGTRKSAISGRLCHKNSDIAWPFLRRLIILKRTYKNKFSQERLERVDRTIEASNATIYTKLADCVVDLKKQETNLRRKKGWSDSEWKRHMEYISQIAMKKKVYPPPPIKRGKSKPLEELLPRIKTMAKMPTFKCYRRQSQEEWYRKPGKVAPNALKYNISERIAKLAVARALHHDHHEDHF